MTRWLNYQKVFRTFTDTKIVIVFRKWLWKMTRGKLILIEGLDRTGKTTQCSILTEKLKPNVELRKFPDRTTPIGNLINDYLTRRENNLPDQAIHLLFSANRWEAAEEIKRSLIEGNHIVLDRYVYSGIAYSGAKEVPNMNINWCLQSDKGLLKPDLTIFLMNADQTQNEVREGFGVERYERSDFQLKVKQKFFEVFEKLDGYPDNSNSNLKILDVTNKSIDEVSDRVWQLTRELIDKDLTNDFAYF